MLGAIQQQVKLSGETFKDETGDFFKINFEILDEPMASFLVAGWVDERVENASDLNEVNGGSLNQGEDETGEEVDAAGIPVKKGFQGLLELSMLVRRASILSDWEAPIVSDGVLDGYPRLMSGTMRSPLQVKRRHHSKILVVQFPTEPSRETAPQL